MKLFICFIILNTLVSKFQFCDGLEGNMYVDSEEFKMFSNLVPLLFQDASVLPNCYQDFPDSEKQRSDWTCYSGDTTDGPVNLERSILRVYTPGVKFGTMFIDTLSERDIYIENTSFNDTIKIGPVLSVSERSIFHLLSGEQLDRVIAPGEIVQIRIIAIPDSIGYEASFLYIYTTFGLIKLKLETYVISNLFRGKSSNGISLPTNIPMSAIIISIHNPYSIRFEVMSIKIEDRVVPIERLTPSACAVNPHETLNLATVWFYDEKNINLIDLISADISESEPNTISLLIGVDNIQKLQSDIHHPLFNFKVHTNDLFIIPLYKYLHHPPTLQKPPLDVEDILGVDPDVFQTITIFRNNYIESEKVNFTWIENAHSNKEIVGEGKGQLTIKLDTWREWLISFPVRETVSNAKFIKNPQCSSSSRSDNCVLSSSTKSYFEDEIRRTPSNTNHYEYNMKLFTVEFGEPGTQGKSRPILVVTINDVLRAMKRETFTLYDSNWSRYVAGAVEGKYLSETVNGQKLIKRSNLISTAIISFQTERRMVGSFGLVINYTMPCDLVPEKVTLIDILYTLEYAQNYINTTVIIQVGNMIPPTLIEALVVNSYHFFTHPCGAMIFGFCENGTAFQKIFCILAEIAFIGLLICWIKGDPTYINCIIEIFRCQISIAKIIYSRCSFTTWTTNKKKNSIRTLPLKKISQMEYFTNIHDFFLGREITDQLPKSAIFRSITLCLGGSHHQHYFEFRIRRESSQPVSSSGYPRASGRNRLNVLGNVAKNYVIPTPKRNLSQPRVNFGITPVIHDSHRINSNNNRNDNIINNNKNNNISPANKCGKRIINNNNNIKNTKNYNVVENRGNDKKRFNLNHNNNNNNNNKSKHNSEFFKKTINTTTVKNSFCTVPNSIKIENANKLNKNDEPINGNDIGGVNVEKFSIDHVVEPDLNNSKILLDDCNSSSISSLVRLNIDQSVDDNSKNDNVKISNIVNNHPSENNKNINTTANINNNYVKDVQKSKVKHSNSKNAGRQAYIGQPIDGKKDTNLSSDQGIEGTKSFGYRNESLNAEDFKKNDISHREKKRNQKKLCRKCSKLESKGKLSMNKRCPCRELMNLETNAAANDVTDNVVQMSTNQGKKENRDTNEQSNGKSRNGIKNNYCNDKFDSLVEKTGMMESVEKFRCTGRFSQKRKFNCKEKSKMAEKTKSKFNSSSDASNISTSITKCNEESSSSQSPSWSKYAKPNEKSNSKIVLEEKHTTTDSSNSISNSNNNKNATKKSPQINGSIKNVIVKTTQSTINEKNQAKSFGVKSGNCPNKIEKMPFNGQQNSKSTPPAKGKLAVVSISKTESLGATKNGMKTDKENSRDTNDSKGTDNYHMMKDNAKYENFVGGGERKSRKRARTRGGKKIDESVTTNMSDGKYGKQSSAFSDSREMYGAYMCHSIFPNMFFTDENEDLFNLKLFREDETTERGFSKLFENDDKEDDKTFDNMSDTQCENTVENLLFDDDIKIGNMDEAFNFDIWNPIYDPALSDWPQEFENIHEGDVYNFPTVYNDPLYSELMYHPLAAQYAMPEGLLVQNSDVGFEYTDYVVPSFS